MGLAVFKTVEGATSPLAGSIPVRLRWSYPLEIESAIVVAHWSISFQSR